MQTSADVSEDNGEYAGSWAVAAQTDVCCEAITPGKQNLNPPAIAKATAGQALR